MLRRCPVSVAAAESEEVEVIVMAKEDDCVHEMFVLILFRGRKLGVPLSQLDAPQAGPETHEAVEDFGLCRFVSATDA